RHQIGDEPPRGLERAQLRAVLAVDELGALDADLPPAAFVLELRRAEAARRRLQRDLVVVLARRRDDLLGDAVQRRHGVRERRRQGQQAHAAWSAKRALRYMTAITSIGRMSGSPASRSAATSPSARGISPLMCAWRASSVSNVSKIPYVVSPSLNAY